MIPHMKRNSIFFNMQHIENKFKIVSLIKMRKTHFVFYIRKVVSTMILVDSWYLVSE